MLYTIYDPQDVGKLPEHLSKFINRFRYKSYTTTNPIIIFYVPPHLEKEENHKILNIGPYILKYLFKGLIRRKETGIF